MFFFFNIAHYFISWEIRKRSFPKHREGSKNMEWVPHYIMEAKIDQRLQHFPLVLFKRKMSLFDKNITSQKKGKNTIYKQHSM